VAKKTYKAWYEERGRKMMCDNSYDREAYGQAQWDAATEATEEKFTSDNNRSDEIAFLQSTLGAARNCYSVEGMLNVVQDRIHERIAQLRAIAVNVVSKGN